MYRRELRRPTSLSARGVFSGRTSEPRPAPEGRGQRQSRDPTRKMHLASQATAMNATPTAHRERLRTDRDESCESAGHDAAANRVREKFVRNAMPTAAQEAARILRLERPNARGEGARPPKADANARGKRQHSSGAATRNARPGATEKQGRKPRCE